MELPMNRTHGKFAFVFVLGLGAGWLGLRSPGMADNPAEASVGGASSGASEIIAFTCDHEGGGKLFCLIDAKEKVLSVYEYGGAKSKLRLAAVRQFAADHQLAEFNNDQPNVAEVQRLVKQR